MKNQKIPDEIVNESLEIINSFNIKVLKNENKIIPEFKGKYLFLNRDEYGKISPLVRLEYTGNMKDWIFAIYRWSDESYDDDELFFPGDEHIDGTIEGAMKAGIEAYPI